MEVTTVCQETEVMCSKCCIRDSEEYAGPLPTNIQTIQTETISVSSAPMPLSYDATLRRIDVQIVNCANSFGFNLYILCDNQDVILRPD